MDPVLHSSYRFLHLLLLKHFRDCIRSEMTLYKSFLHYITYYLISASVMENVTFVEL